MTVRRRCGGEKSLKHKSLTPGDRTGAARKPFGIRAEYRCCRKARRRESEGLADRQQRCSKRPPPSPRQGRALAVKAGCAPPVTGWKVGPEIGAEARLSGFGPNAALAAEAGALRPARVSRPAPVTEMRSLMPLAAWVEQAAETRRRGLLLGEAERIEVRRQGVGSDAGPHFACAGLRGVCARLSPARA